MISRDLTERLKYKKGWYNFDAFENGYNTLNYEMNLNLNIFQEELDILQNVGP